MDAQVRSQVILSRRDLARIEGSSMILILGAAQGGGYGSHNKHPSVWTVDGNRGGYHDIERSYANNER